MMGLRKVLSGSRAGSNPRAGDAKATRSSLSGLRELTVEEQKAVSGGRKQAVPG